MIDIFLFSISVPLLAPFIAPFFKPRAATSISFLSFIIPFVTILYHLFFPRNWEFLWMDFVAPIGAFYLMGDAISHAFGLAICIVSAMVALYSLPYMKHRFEEMGLDLEKEYRKYIFLYDLYAVSMLWLLYSGNLLLLYIFLEIALITSFLLIYFYGYGNRRWVGILYLIWTSIAGVLALIGFLVIAIDNSTLALNGIKTVSSAAWGLIFLGMIVKLPIAGPHIWLPWAHAEAPTPVSALLSPLTVGLAGYILLRIYLVDSWFIEMYRIPIITYAIISSIYAGFSVFRQRDYKRLLAYSTVSQMGYLLIALCLGSPGLLGVVIQYISHALGKSVLFMTAGAIITLYGLRDLGKMSGFHEYVPTISNAALIGFMTLSGVLTIGMFGEFFILKGVKDVFGFNLFLILGVVFIFILSGLYSFYTIRLIFYRTPVKGYEKARVPLLLNTPLYVNGLLAVLLIFPPLITALIQGLKISLGLP